MGSVGAEIERVVAPEAPTEAEQALARATQAVRRARHAGRIDEARHLAVAIPTHLRARLDERVSSGALVGEVRAAKRAAKAKGLRGHDLDAAIVLDVLVKELRDLKDMLVKHVGETVLRDSA